MIDLLYITYTYTLRTTYTFATVTPVVVLLSFIFHALCSLYFLSVSFHHSPPSHIISIHQSNLYLAYPLLFFAMVVI